MNRVLLLACSSQKREDAGLLPAVERYDGPPFRLLRKYARAEPKRKPQTYVVSAKYGLVSGDTPIPNYNKKMTRQRAEELRGSVTQKLQKVLSENVNVENEGEVFLLLGKTYFQAVGDLHTLPQGYQFLTAQGMPGGKLSALYDWLYGKPPPTEAKSHRKERAKPKIRGIEIDLSMEQVNALVDERLKSDDKAFRNFQAWYVSVDGERISPKWLVSQITGLPVSAFHSSEARRVLAQLGFEVKRV